MIEIADPRRQPSSFEIERQARLARSLAIGTCLRGVARGFAEWVRFLARRSARLARHWAAERLRREAVRALDQLDDRTLADIGVRRCEIDFAVRNGLPCRPTPKRSRRAHDRGRVLPQRRAA
jgi:uncharacterized protein YjiS (DUF1127 family)